MSSITIVTIHSSTTNLRICSPRQHQSLRLHTWAPWWWVHSCFEALASSCMSQWDSAIPLFRLLHLQERPSSVALTDLELHREGLGSYQGYFVGLKAKSRATLATSTLCSVAFLREQQVQPKQPQASSISKGTLFWGQDQLLA